MAYFGQNLRNIMSKSKDNFRTGATFLFLILQNERCNKSEYLFQDLYYLPTFQVPKVNGSNFDPTSKICAN
jgi:hypothetical protein